ncbi:hypothetical protein [Arthrobacter sp. IK3]|uniref:hypothetical protein n=1 Tax=Arthrobacter sp. IK3 TaxID=3448169 RepID=UPI003EE0FA7A
MADGRPYVVIEADYLDREEGIIPGRRVAAVPGGVDGQLLITAIEDTPLASPVAVFASQLQASDTEAGAE